MERFKLRFKRNVSNLYSTHIPRVLNALPTREERVFICPLKILWSRNNSRKDRNFTRYNVNSNAILRVNFKRKNFPGKSSLNLTLTHLKITDLCHSH
jgi:hypothetical protein